MSYASWLNGPYDAETKAQILDLEKNNPEELQEAFSGHLHFGTGGLRGLMGVGTNRINQYTVALATQGLANYLKKQNETTGVFIGFDSRHFSDVFAKEAALVLAGNDIPVFLCPDIRPTPFVSFGVRAKNCSAGIVITASHNPKEYNGYKVYWKDGAQIVPPHDKGIIEEVKKITSIDQVKRAVDPSPLIQIVDKTLDEAYLDAIHKCQIDKREDEKVGDQLKIVYTPLHGTGIKLLPRALMQWGFTSIDLVERQIVPNGDFPTVESPNPESKKALEMGVKQLEETAADLLIATDPDADRMAAAVLHKGKANYLNGNQIACLIAEYLLYQLKEMGRLPPDGAVASTIVSTDLLGQIASRYNVAYFTTLTGFKYIGELIRLWEEGHSPHTFLFGAEESYGYLVGTHARDKDAIVSSCLLAEIALFYKAEGRTLIDALDDLYETYGYFLEGQKTVDFPPGNSGMEKMQQCMDQLRTSAPKTLLDETITKQTDYLLEETGLPQSNVLLFRSSSYKIIVRPSGTEPKLKIYGAVHLPTKQPKEAAQKLKELLDTFSF